MITRQDVQSRLEQLVDRGRARASALLDAIQTNLITDEIVNVGPRQTNIEVFQVDSTERGILVAPGEFYGPRGARHVRVALTATDERIAAAVARLA